MLKRIKDGDDGAKNILIQKYFRFCWKIAKDFSEKYCSIGVPFEEYYSLACSQLSEIIDKYDSDYCMFYPYWKICTERKLNNLVRKVMSKGEQSMFSFDYSYEYGTTLHDVCGVFDDASHNNLLYEMFCKIIFNPDNHFTLNEREVLIKVLDGYEISQIVTITNKPRATIYRTYTKAIAKLRKYLGGNK